MMKCGLSNLEVILIGEEKNSKMIISVASGKGGTGKTTIAVNLALSLKYVQLIDCDVEEPNASIFIKPDIRNIEDVNVLVPKINSQLCDYCGKCAEFCKYNALAVIEHQVLIFPEICHHCGGCKIICPQNAVSEYEISIGKIRKGMVGPIEFLDGTLNISHPSCVPIINKLKRYISTNSKVIIDAPPGTSCAMIETVESSDFCILVTEPTPFGLNDLKLAVEVVRKLNIPFGIILNQCDIGDDRVQQYCKQNNIDILMEIPYNRKIAEAYSKGISILDSISEYKDKFQGLYKRIEEELK